MLERTFSFWRRWAGSADSADSTAVAAADTADERRLWVRYPAELQAQVQLADEAQRHKMAARIRDLSRGGVNLLLDQEVRLGQLLNLDLQTDRDGVLTVLACVIRAEQDRDGQWALGCVFSRELSEEDLLAFGARRVRHAPKDQRTWMRFDCNRQAVFQTINDPESQPQSAQVLNLSASGIGLLVDRFIDAGSLLNVDLLDKEGRPARTILSCVVHVAAQGDGAWALGCNFIRELSEDDLHALL